MATQHREWALAYVLCAILLLNVIAITILSNKTPDRRLAPSPMNASNIAHAPSPPRHLVRTILLEDTAACPDCFDIGQYATALNETFPIALEIGDWQAWRARLAADSRDVPNAKRLPAIAFNGTLAEYPDMVENWTSLGYTIAFGSGPYEGEWYVLPTLNPPYLDLKDDAVHGRVTVAYITDTSCAQCYDPHAMRSFLNESRIVPYRERDIDVSAPEGLALASRYNITRVPTIVLSPEASLYPGFLPGWDVVGTVEADGSLVLRDLQRIGLAYRDLGTGKVMKP